MDETSRPLIYISYRWRGAKEVADELVSRLGEVMPDVEIFQDSASLHPGEHWPGALQHALSRASALVVLIDWDWLRHDDSYGRRRLDDPSDWVRQELERSLERGIPVVPLLLDGAELPPAQALPDALLPLAQLVGARLHRKTLQEDVQALAGRLAGALDGSDAAPTDDALPFQVLDVELSQFRCFEHLRVDFAPPSSLPGDWTCIAGINGSGKSTILQALALVIMGPDRAREFGGRRVAGMRRRDPSGERHDARLRARVRHLGEELYLDMSIDDSGPSGPDPGFWSYAQDLLAVGYGASRNLSEAPDRFDDLSPMVRAAISLFHPMARLQSVDSILERGRRPVDPAATAGTALFRQLVGSVFGDELQIRAESDRLEFSRGSATIGPLELPDGFRSSVAWMADLCVRWATLRGSESAEPHGADDDALSRVTGIVLLDEIDLHLHPSLQRAIVPRLREALPNVQFVVTSHAPLILASFDRNELVPLDSDADDGIRELDRQILGFSADEIYEWLLGTPASSEAVEREMAGAGQAPSRREALAEVLAVGPEVSEEQAKARLERVRNRMGRLKR